MDFFLCFRKVAAISEKYGKVRRSTEAMAISSRFFRLFFVQRRKNFFLIAMRRCLYGGSDRLSIRTNPYKSAQIRTQK